MATKKSAKKSKANPKKSVKKKAAAPKKPARAKKLAQKKKTAPNKPVPKKKAPPKKPASRAKRGSVVVRFKPAGPGSDAGGQSGDVQGLPDKPRVDSESVEELVEEGNAYEAGIVDGVENAPDPDQGEIKTHEVPEDDVPDEYTDKDQ